MRTPIKSLKINEIFPRMCALPHQYIRINITNVIVTTPAVNLLEIYLPIYLRSILRPKVLLIGVG